MGAGSEVVGRTVAGPAAADAVAPGRLALGDAEFAAFHATTARPLWNYLRAASGSAALADDLVQESFLRLLRAKELPSGDEDRRRYVFRIGSNLLHDHRRATRRFLDAPDAGERTEARGASSPPAPREDLDRCLARLAPRERQLLWLAHVEEASHAEIAALTGVAAKSVRVLLFRARRKLAALLEPGTGRRSR
jgi:RNA polymerase sigma-70 factor (ECF subfamily)